MGQPKKVCLITPGHIASNPRLLKEAIALEQQGYGIHIIFTQYLPYLQEKDFAILSLHPSWTYSALDWTGNSWISKVRRITSGVQQKLSLKFNRLLIGSNFRLLSINRFFSWQLQQAIFIKADLYIGHNLGALPVSFWAAKLNNSKAGFDAEDFHRQQNTDDTSSKSYQNTKLIEDLFIPSINHFTTASPLITIAYKKLYPNLQEATTILNVFPKTKKRPTISSTIKRPIQLFWFSQTVGMGRGVEEIIEAVGLCKRRDIELHLLGYCSLDMRNYFSKQGEKATGDSSFLNFHEPVSEKDLFQIASRYDIGLAAETGVPFNREICLTNKIFTYIQAGLAVVASDTEAQVQLLSTYNNIGNLYSKGSVSELAAILTAYQNDPELLQQHKQSSFLLGQQELNWEREGTKFIAAIQKNLY